MLPLIGQLCDHVTSVDMSWSGATDTGVKALSDGCAGSVSQIHNTHKENVQLKLCKVSVEGRDKCVEIFFM